MSDLERVQADAQNGVSISVGLARARALIAAPLMGAKNELQALCLPVKNSLISMPPDNQSDASLAINTNIILSDAKAQLSEAMEAVQQAINSKKAFKLRHGLGREPIKNLIFLGVITLGCAVVGETGLNSIFFQNAHMAATPTAALVMSGLISLCNIMVSTCAGFFIGRRLNYGSNAIDSNTPEFKNIRTRAKVFHFLFIAVIAFFHLTVGLVRAQESMTEIEHSLPAYLQFLQTPEAIFLVLTGLCLSLIAWHKGRSSFSDPYFGYGEHQKSVDDAREALVNLREDLNNQLVAVYEDTIGDENKLNRQQQKAIKQYNHAVNQCHQNHQQLIKSVHQAEDDLSIQTSQMIEIYRSVGREVESDFNRETHGSFQEFLVVDLPELQPPPEPSVQSIALNQMKASASEQLGNIFSEISQSNTGELK